LSVDRKFVWFYKKWRRKTWFYKNMEKENMN
jgi:hypothetical protein